MKLAGAAFAVAVMLALPASTGASGERVLGIDGTVLGSRLAWYAPATLTRLPGRTVSLANHFGEWARSPNGKRLVVSSMVGAHLRFIDVERMRVLGSMRLGSKSSPFAFRWLSANRLIAVGEHSIEVVDPTRLRVVTRRTFPSSVLAGAASIPNGVALLLGEDINGFAPAKVATVDAEGRVRAKVLDRITIGYFHQGDTYEIRQAGFAVDPLTQRAFVVGGDYTIAEVDLASQSLSYHGGSTRWLAKEVPGPMRWARWLGNGLIAVAGSDTLQADGLRIVDTRDWSTTIVDRTSSNLALGTGGIVGTNWPRFWVYGLDGSLRYHFSVENGQQLQVAGRFAYVCNGLTLVGVVDLTSGASSDGAQRTCVTVLAQ